MENIKQLNDLRLRVNNLRKRGNKKAFPEDLKIDALELAGKIGMSKVARQAGLSSGLLYIWKNKARNYKAEKCDLQNVDLQITRIISTNSKAAAPLLLASVTRGDVEIRFFDATFATAVCEKLLS